MYKRIEDKCITELTINVLNNRRLMSTRIED